MDPALVTDSDPAGFTTAIVLGAVVLQSPAVPKMRAPEVSRPHRMRSNVSPWRREDVETA
jgi:hypothetical protein